MPRTTRPLIGVLLLASCASAPPPRREPTAPAAPPPPAETTPLPERATPAVSAPSETPPAEHGIHAAPDKPTADAFADVGFHEVKEKDWVAGVRQKVAAEWKVEPSALIVSPGMLHAAFVKGPPEPPVATAGKKKPSRPPPRRFQIIVVDNQARKLATFRPVTLRGSDEPPKDLRFLDEDRLVYEAVPAPPPPPPEATPAARPEPPATAKKNGAKTRAVSGAKSGAKPKTTAKAKGKPNPPPAKTAHATAAPAPPAPEKPVPPTRLFIIQPIEAQARPTRCEGWHHTVSATGGHLAYLAGTPEAGFVSVDGTAVYPRSGRTVIPNAVAWSKDGRSLAFVETPTGNPARLVLLAEYDNPTGDTTWTLPASAPVDGTRAFWAGAGKLVVGKSLTRPVFSASFEKHLPR